jgi:hypothetical protein
LAHENRFRPDFYGRRNRTFSESRTVHQNHARAHPVQTRTRRHQRRPRDHPRNRAALPANLNPCRLGIDGAPDRGFPGECEPRAQPRFNTGIPRLVALVAPATATRADLVGVSIPLKLEKLICASGKCGLNGKMRLHHILLPLLVLSACTTRVTRDPVVQPEPVIEPKPVLTSTPVVSSLTTSEITHINGNAKPAFPDRPGEVTILIRQVYDANANGVVDADEHTVPRWAVRLTPVDVQNISVGRSRLLYTPDTTDLNAGVFVNVPAGRYKIEFLNPTAAISTTDPHWQRMRNTWTAYAETTLDLKTASTDSTTMVLTNLAFCGSGSAAALNIEPFASTSIDTWKCFPKYDPKSIALNGGFRTNPQRNTWQGVVTRPYQAVVLSWDADYDTKAFINQGIGEVQGNSVTVQPSVTTTYTLTLKNEFGSTTQSETIIPSADSRLNPNFGTNGHLLTEGLVIPVGSQSDGKVIAYRSATKGYDLNLVRLNQDGSLDSSFKAPEIRIEGSFSPHNVQIFPNDTIVACDRLYSNDAKLYFLQADGTPLSSFGSNGALSVPNCNSLGVAYASENEVTVTQFTASGQELLYVNKTGIRQRFKLNTVYDRLFSVDGGQFLAVSSTTRRGGTIYTVNWTMQRLNRDGTVDPSFAAIRGGGLDSSPGSYVTGVLQVSGTIILNDGFSINAYELDGQPKPSFFAHLTAFFQDGENNPGFYSMYGQNFSSPLLIRWSETGFTAIQIDYDGRLIPYVFYDGAASIYSPGFNVAGAVPTKNGWFISSKEPSRFDPEHPKDFRDDFKYLSYMLR